MTQYLESDDAIAVCNNGPLRGKMMISRHIIIVIDARVREVCIHLGVSNCSISQHQWFLGFNTCLSSQDIIFRLFCLSFYALEKLVRNSKQNKYLLFLSCITKNQFHQHRLEVN